MSAPDLPAPVSVDVTEIRFISLLDPAPKYNEKQGDTYSLCFPWRDVPESLADVFAGAILAAKQTVWGLVTVRSNRRPMIFGAQEDASDLISLRSKCDARNLHPHALLVGQPATVHLTFWKKDKDPSAKVGVSLNAVTIFPSKIKFPGPLDDIYGDR